MSNTLEQYVKDSVLNLVAFAQEPMKETCICELLHGMLVLSY